MAEKTYEQIAQEKLNELLGIIGDVEGTEILESKAMTDIPDGDHVVMITGLYRLGPVYNWVPVLDKKTKNITATLTKKPQICFTVIYKNMATGTTETKDFTAEDHFSPNNHFHDVVMASLRDDEKYDEKKPMPAYFLKPAVISINKQKIKKALKIRPDQLANLPDFSTVKLKYFDASKNVKDEDIEKLRSLPKHIIMERSVKLSKEPKKPSQEEIEETYRNYENSKPFTSLVKKAA